MSTTKIIPEGSGITSMSGLTDFNPPDDNATDLGSGVKRWKDIYAGNAVIQTSDATLKYDVTPCSNGLQFIMKLKPVDFKFIGGNRVHSGFLAQQVEEVLPSDRALFVKDAVSGLCGLRYEEIIAPVVSAIQEINDKLDDIAVPPTTDNRDEIDGLKFDINAAHDNCLALSEELSDLREQVRCLPENPPVVTEDLKPVLQTLQQRVERVEGVHKTVLDAAEQLEHRVNENARHTADAVLNVDKTHTAIRAEISHATEPLAKRVDQLQDLVEAPRKNPITVLEICLVVGVVVDFVLHFVLK